MDTARDTDGNLPPDLEDRLLQTRADSDYIEADVAFQQRHTAFIDKLIFYGVAERNFDRIRLVQPLGDQIGLMLN